MAGYITVTIERVTYERLLTELKNGIEACDDAGRLRVELVALRRHLQELIPVNPPNPPSPSSPSSRTDIKAAFDNSVEFASGRKKPPEHE